MATVQDRYNNWALEELRWATQVNKKVWLAWYNKGLQIFQKTILEYVSGKQNTSVTYADIEKDVDEYPLPVFDNEEHVEDFYSIVQLRVAYHNDKFWNPIYRVCKPIDFGDYNIRPALNKREKRTRTYKRHKLIDPSLPEDDKTNWVVDGSWNYVYEYVNVDVLDKEWNEIYDLKQQWGRQVGSPYVRNRISEVNPRYIFVPKYENWVYKSDIKIFPTPTKDIDRWLTLTYNFVQQPITELEAFWDNDHDPIDESTLNLPRYFFDAIEDYITFRLYQAENPEMAQRYYQQFQQTLNDNIYGLNKDKRPIEEDFANTSYFSHY